MDDELILKNNLKKARTEKGYSQAALAKENRSITQYHQLY